MKILEIDLTNIRTFKHVNYKVPSGLSLLTGPNGSGKSTLFQATAWALWGVVPGRSQDLFVRHGEREMVAKVPIRSNGRVYSIERRFRLNKNGKGGVTKLTFTNEATDLTQSINKETQAKINEICGTYEVWAMTAYVGQREGAGQFLEGNVYERKQVFRDILPAARGWDKWEGEAKTHAAKCGTAINRIEGALPAMEEAAEKLAAYQLDAAMRRTAVYTAKAALDKAESAGPSEVSPEILQRFDAHEVKIAERQAEIDKARAQNDRVNTANIAASDRHDKAMAVWRKADSAWQQLSNEVDESADAEIKAAEEKKYKAQQILTLTESLTNNICSECRQQLNDEHAAELGNQRDVLFKEVGIPEPAIQEADETIQKWEDFTHPDEPVQPPAPAYKPNVTVPLVLAPDPEITAAKEAAEHAAEEHVRIAREAHSESTTAVALAEDHVEQARLAMVDLSNTREKLAEGKIALHQWETVVAMCGTNGIRQLIIDQSLGAMESASNRWLQIIAPGFEIAFSTQTETDRETFEEGVIMPSGAIQPWSELSGAQSVAVALAVRLGLAEIGGAAQGIHYETMYLDEADSWLEGDYQQQFMAMLNRVADTGIDVIAISHIESVQEMVDQQTRVVPIDSETSEVRT